MLSPDVNVLVYAHRKDSRDHTLYARWISTLATGREPFALSMLALGGFARVVTNARIFREPSALPVALAFCQALIDRPTARVIAPGPDHWALFSSLCAAVGASGKLVADAQHAAVAIEHGCTWVSADGDFARFPGLRWRHPLRPA